MKMPCISLVFESHRAHRHIGHIENRFYIRKEHIVIDIE